jgi:geranylgeranyl diphosphate synthase type II
MIQHPEEIQSWFTHEAISKVLNRSNTRCEKIAVNFVSRSGHRLRPWITAGVCEALTGKVSDDCRSVAIAMELIHKASLIHDDIEDGDAFRDGFRTVHAEYGIAAAINAGDFLIHSSYSLISDSNSARKACMLQSASLYQLEMCLGQDKDLCGQTGDEVTALKTSSAFTLSVRLGELAASEEDHISANFGALFGKAYQALDDRRDSKSSTMPELKALREFTTWDDRVTAFLRRVVSHVFPESPAQPTQAACQLQPIAQS